MSRVQLEGSATGCLSVRDFEISEDFSWDFGISQEISGFQLGFRDFTRDFLRFGILPEISGFHARFGLKVTRTA